ncbi:MAG: hypothetical protein M2R45_02796 [Verrucomicrobia subdivision 3 bacterium]|nr:hypothetical protein [Limisphaerales bacterium]MCS1414348.1 hypothetical protein [Limisphaerales bacterium]
MSFEWLAVKFTGSVIDALTFTDRPLVIKESVASTETNESR